MKKPLFEIDERHDVDEDETEGRFDTWDEESED